jgi:hypothetical protein
MLQHSALFLPFPASSALSLSRLKITQFPFVNQIPCTTVGKRRAKIVSSCYYADRNRSQERNPCWSNQAMIL